MTELACARTFIRFAALATGIIGMQLLLPRLAVGRILLFEDATASSGINLSGETHTVAWGDFNHDGCPDLWITKHSGTTGGNGQAGTLYQNLCNGHFRDVTKTVIGDLSDGLDFHGAAWADFDNDGDIDLMQLVGGDKGVGVSPGLRARLFVNSGGKLVDRAAEFGVAYPLARGRMPLWLDYDKDGKLDLFFGADHRPDGKSPPTIFHQRNHGFENARSRTAFNLDTCLYAIISDLNNDRGMELVAISGVEGAAEQTEERNINIFQTSKLPFVDLTSQFFSNARLNATFSEIAIADFNNDLRPDIYITRKPVTHPDQLLINTGSHFVDRSLAAGISSLQIAGSAVAAADFDNDGDIDLYIDQPSRTANRPNILLENRGDGTFVAISDAGGPTDTPRGGGSMAVADYDNDGFLDIAVTNGNFTSPEGNVHLLHNLGNENHWLKVQLIGKVSNRQGIGATVIVTTNGRSQLREANGGTHRFAQDDRIIHFGVGGSTVVDKVVVRWSSGKNSVLTGIASDHVLSVSE